MKTTINVSRNNIRYGDLFDDGDCVIARAICDSLPLVDRAWVGNRTIRLDHVTGGTAYVEMPTKMVRYIVSMLVAQIILRKLHPRWIYPAFSFTLDVPEIFLAKDPVRPEQIRREEKEAPALLPV